MLTSSGRVIRQCDLVLVSVMYHIRTYKEPEQSLLIFESIKYHCSTELLCPFESEESALNSRCQRSQLRAHCVPFFRA